MPLFTKGVYNLESLKIDLEQILKDEYFKFGLKIGLLFNNELLRDESILTFRIYIPLTDLCRRLNVSRITLSKWIKSNNSIEIKEFQGRRAKRIELHSLYEFLSSQAHKL